MTRPGMTRDRWVALFLAGLTGFSPPLLFIFSTEITVFGIPLLYVYMFTAWALIIALTAWIADAQSALEARDRKRSQASAGERRRSR
ncbi:MAG: hypothetical protein QNJ94_17280 [Alphaproteobacteria bacterium]|nr:hypothetical protein [Alphaproteobacteria bacterium]